MKLYGNTAHALLFASFLWLLWLRRRELSSYNREQMAHKDCFTILTLALKRKGLPIPDLNNCGTQKNVNKYSSLPIIFLILPTGVPLVLSQRKGILLFGQDDGRALSLLWILGLKLEDQVTEDSGSSFCHQLAM